MSPRHPDARTTTWGSDCSPSCFLRRRAALNALNSPVKIPAWPFVLLLAFFVAVFTLNVLAGLNDSEPVLGDGAALVFIVMRFAIAIAVLIQCFRIKDVLEDHLSDNHASLAGTMLANQSQLSGVMTFLFTIFYLQHVINRDVLAPRELV